MIKRMIPFFLLLPILISCNKPLVHSRDREMTPISQTFSAPPEDAIKAAKEVLVGMGYKIEREDLSEKTITTGWQSTKATSHYVDLFGRKDYGTVGAYYQIRLRVSERAGKADVEVAAPVRSVVGRIQSSHREEKKILKKMADLLRREDFEMTNVGVQE